MRTSDSTRLACLAWALASVTACAGPPDAQDPGAQLVAGSASVPPVAGSAGTSGVGVGGSSSGGAGASGVMGGAAGGASSECSASLPTSLFCDPLQPMPKTFAATGLFPAAPDFSKHAPSLLGFTPSPPLWTDGMGKERFILLPQGKKIDNANPKAWVFPVGTILVKTFFDDSGAGGVRRPIETRIIRRVGTETDFTEYDYYLYQWNEAGTDAELIVDDRNGDSQAAKMVDITINRMVDGKPFVLNGGKPFAHALPSRDNCGDCHHENGNTYQTFVGFDEIRLNHKLSASSAKTQLEDFEAAGIFTQPRAPGSVPRSILESDPTLLQVKEFVLGNCVHCHNQKGKVFDMAPEVFVANTVGQPSNAQSVQPPAGWLRVKPGEPEKSVLFVQARRTPLPEPTMAGGNRLRPMPPVGVNDLTPDAQGIAAIEAWIEGLK